MSDREKGMEIDKNYSDDAEFMRSMFEQDGIEAPEGLSKESVTVMLANVQHERDESTDNEKKEGADAVNKESTSAEKKEVRGADKKAAGRSWHRTLGWAAAIAACLMLVVIPQINSGKTGTEELLAFSSYDEVYRKIDEIIERNSRQYERGYGVLEDVVESEAVEDSASNGSSLKTFGRNAAAAEPSGADGSSHSETYLQVEGFDEADKVKVDGKYLYFIDSTRSRILIYETEDGKAEKISVIRADDGMTFSDMFLSGDRLTAVGIHYGYYPEGGSRMVGDGHETSVAVYDVSSRNRPVRTAEYVQSGYPVSQRMVGDILYLVTDQYAYDKAVPYCGSEEKTEKIPAGDISCVPSPASAEYTVIGAVDTSSGKELGHVTKAVLGGSQDIYANGENLYVAGTTYIRREGGGSNGGAIRKFFMPNRSGQAATMIIKVRMKNGDIKITDSAVVNGTIDDQFSMDERNGKFRIATTSVSENGDQVNNLFVLDRKLNELGHVSGFARGESIKAVRYVRNKAYVITYEQTDPLFVIDLTDSKAPEIEGEVKIDGFSTLLLPLSEDRLLGVGYGTRQVETWQETSGIKFALFDISDPSSPKVVTSKTMEGIFSEVQEDHRALVMLGEGEDAEFILPCWKEPYDDLVEYGVDEDAEAGDAESSETEIDVYGGEQEYGGPAGGVLTIRAAGDRIDMLSYDEVKDAVERCPVIGNFIYAVTENDDVVPVRLTK